MIDGLLKRKAAINTVVERLHIWHANRERAHVSIGLPTHAIASKMLYDLDEQIGRAIIQKILALETEKAAIQVKEDAVNELLRCSV